MSSVIYVDSVGSVGSRGLVELVIKAIEAFAGLDLLVKLLIIAGIIAIGYCIYRVVRYLIENWDITIKFDFGFLFVEAKNKPLCSSCKKMI